MAAGALQLHGEADPAVRKEALDLQKMIRAAGGDAAAAAAAHSTAPMGPYLEGNPGAAHGSSALPLPAVLQWASRREALQSGASLPTVWPSVRLP